MNLKYWTIETSEFGLTVRTKRIHEYLKRGIGLFIEESIKNSIDINNISRDKAITVFKKDVSGDKTYTQEERDELINNLDDIIKLANF
jgi:hypothetical protein